MYDKINYVRKYRKSKIGVFPSVAKDFPGTRKKIIQKNLFVQICTTHGVTSKTNGIRNMWNFGHCSAKEIYYMIMIYMTLNI